jgi:hypothetical protein
MATKQILAVLDVAGVKRGRFTDSRVLADDWVLTKPEVNFLIAITRRRVSVRLACGARAFSVNSPPPYSPRHCPRGEGSR